MTVENPDTIEVSLKLTMTLKEWRELRNQLPNAWPGWQVGSYITDMIRQAEKTFYPQNTEEP